MDRGKRRRLMIVMLIAIIVIAASDAALLLHAAFTPAPAYTFQTGVNHPQEIKDLMKNGTVVLFFTENGCPPCDDMRPKVADLQSQYKGTGVTFAAFNAEDNATSKSIIENYGIKNVPEVFVIRSDGAVANFTGANTDIKTVQSAIDDARNWRPPVQTSRWPF